MLDPTTFHRTRGLRALVRLVLTKETAMPGTWTAAQRRKYNATMKRKARLEAGMIDPDPTLAGDVKEMLRSSREEIEAHRREEDKEIIFESEATSIVRENQDKRESIHSALDHLAMMIDALKEWVSDKDLNRIELEVKTLILTQVI